jgi:protoheme IX farnesyltransferase
VEILAALLELSKLRITIAVTLSTLTGYILFSETIDPTGLYVSLGVFFLAMSSSALNQYQERKTDALMRRTKDRPLPSGKLSTREAILFVAILFIAGSIVLYWHTNIISLLIGWLSFFWYNAVYTPLKYRTVFALIIGSLIGALPPVIGWTAAGGYALDMPVLFLAFFIYIWQVPHFILLLLLYGDDYKDAGLPVLTTYYDLRQVKRIIFLWILGTMITGLMLPFMSGMGNMLLSVLIMILSVGLFLSMIRLIQPVKDFREKRAFIAMNIYLVLVLIILSVDKLI